MDTKAGEGASQNRKLPSTEPPEGSSADDAERRDTLSALRELALELGEYVEPGTAVGDVSARELIIVRSAIRQLEADDELREALIIHVGRLERIEGELTQRFLLATDNPEEVHEEAADRADARARTFGYADALHVQGDVYGECSRELRRLLGIERQPELPFGELSNDQGERRNAMRPPAPVSFAPLAECGPNCNGRVDGRRWEAVAREPRPLSLVERARRALWSYVLPFVMLACLALGCEPMPCTSSAPSDGSVAPAWDGSFAPDACDIAQAFASERGCPTVDCAALIGTSSCEPSRVPLCLDALAQSDACPQDVLTLPVCAQLCSGGGA